MLLIRSKFSNSFRVSAGLISRASSAARSKAASNIAINAAQTLVPERTPSSASPFPKDNFNPRIPTRTEVTIVRTREHARSVVNILMANPEAIWACDTEVADINVKEQSPVGNGKVICVSIYGGDHIDFGTGSTLWIDNYGDAFGVLDEFKAWFENDKYKKVWHNYGFDRHVMDNMGIRCKGFLCDTMHMARLWDTSRDKVASGGGSGEGYSLAALTETFFETSDRFVKTKMIDLFGVAKLKKDGTPSKKKELPDMVALQTDPTTRENWIEYSARDAVATWWVRFELEKRLVKMPWKVDDRVMGTMYDFYLQYWRDFGELLTDMESNGIKVDTKNHLRKAELAARSERERMEKLFLIWAELKCPAAKDINIASTGQIQQLLFGHYEKFEMISRDREFSLEKTEEQIVQETEAALATNKYALLTAPQLKELLKERGLKMTGKKGDLMQRLLDYDKNPTAAEDDHEMPSDEINMSYHKLKLAELREICENRGLKTEDGKRKLSKAEMVAMLEEEDETIRAELAAVEYAEKSNEELKRILLHERFITIPTLRSEHDSENARLVELLIESDNIYAGYQRLSPRELKSEVLAIVPDSKTLNAESQRRHLAAVKVSQRHPEVEIDFSPPSVTAPSTDVTVSSTTPSSNVDDIAEPEDKENALGNIKRKRDFVLSTIGMTPEDFTATGLPQVSAAVLKKLAGKNLFVLKKTAEPTAEDLAASPPVPDLTVALSSEEDVYHTINHLYDDNEAVWGTAFDFFGGGEAGKAACRAIGALAAVGQVDTTINTFLVPLQELVDAQGRIHCSLNLNTETGRLSSRRPNLQNQPALEKDQYKIRDAFIAEEGKTFIVADYGQLELRILAHITDCHSMIEAFRQGNMMAGCGLKLLCCMTFALKSAFMGE